MHSVDVSFTNLLAVDVPGEVNWRDRWGRHAREVHQIPLLVLR